MKKLTLIAAIILTAIASRAQTNSIIFPQLLSCTNTVLMTNAEFRCTTGSRVVFLSGGNYEIYEAESLNTNVLNQLGCNVQKMKRAQLDLEAADKSFWNQRRLDEKKYADSLEAKKKADAAARLLRLETEAGFY